MAEKMGTVQRGATVQIHFHEPKRDYPIEADRAREMYPLLLAVHGRAHMEAVDGVIHVYFGELS